MAIGVTLRQARETQMLSIEDIENETKIIRKYLEALENEQFHILPDHFYARSFLILSARFIGLNTSEIIEIFDKTYPSNRQVVIEQFSKTRLNSYKYPFKYKLTPRTRLAANRDLQIMKKARDILAEKKSVPYLLRSLKYLLSQLPL